MSLDTGFSAQVPSLPDSGGVASTLGETFTPEASTGSANFSVRLDTPNGPNDIGPRLELRYDGTNGNGAFGLGFRLALPRIQRSIVRGTPRYDAGDSLILEGAGELLSLPDGTLQPVVESGAWRVALSGDGYVLLDRQGARYTLGTSPAARQYDALASPDGARDATFAWHLERIEDALGNAVVFDWERHDNQLYLAAVRYGVYEIAFLHGERPDPVRWGRCGFLVTTRRRCTRIELRLPRDAQPILRRWDLGYAQHELNGCSLLSRVTLSGLAADGQALSAPALALGYASARPRTLQRMQVPVDLPAPGPLQRSRRRCELIDWFGTGLPDLLEVSSSGEARAWPNLGGLAWGRPQPVGTLPEYSAPEAQLALMDVDGDGMADIVRVDRPLAGYVPRTRAGFQRPVSWPQAPTAVPAGADVRFVDADGDGALDLLVAVGNTVAIYYRDAASGWSATPQLLPADVLSPAALRDLRVFFADMCGSGVVDKVRVDGTGVTYWPSLGRGRFGGPVTMANPPDLPFDVDPARLFLQDIDGDGCADLVYLDQGRVSVWVNQAGNGFGERRDIGFLPVAAIAEARWADMTGSGAAGLLWSTTVAGRVSYFFLDFVGGVAPYLLEHIESGTGLVTDIAYSTSAREAARDRADGAPWPTSMPLVLPVVAAVERRDQGTDVVSRTEYRYHDGRYDGVLREFAGFGRVEVVSIGDAAAPSLLETSWFQQGLAEDGSEPRTALERMARRALRGNLRRKERRSPDGGPLDGLLFDRLEQDWIAVPFETPAGTCHRPRLVQSRLTSFERTPDPVSVHTVVNAAWDDAGNVVDSVQTDVSPLDAAPALVLRTLCSYAVDPARRFLSLPWRTRQFDAAGELVADAIVEYDHAAPGQAAAQGLVTRRSALVLPDALVDATYGAAMPDLAALGYFRRPGETGWWTVQAEYTRTDDADGLRGTTKDATGAMTRYVFNDDRTFPASVTDPMGNTVIIDHDARVARVVRITDAGGATRTARYDALARIVARVDPGDSDDLPTLEFEYLDDRYPVSVARRRRSMSGSTDMTSARDLYDGEGRVIEQREGDFIGEMAVASTRHGARGFVARTWRPFRRPSSLYGDPGDTVPSTTTFRDALGRTVRVVSPDASERVTTYGPLLRQEADEEDTRVDAGALHHDTPLRRHLDAAGRVVRVEQNLQGRWLPSTQAFDLKGNIVRHANESGNVVEFWFDLFGRRLRVRRPERDVAVVLDAAGRQVEVRVVGAEPVFKDYDAAGRPTAVRIGSSAAPPSQTLVYHDAGRAAPPDAGTNTLGGRLVRVDDEAGIWIFDYDARGRQAHRRWQAAAGGPAYSVDIEFRADGRAAAVTYPDGGAGRRRVEQVYDVRGQLASVLGVVPEVDLDIDGRVTRLRHANGVELATTFDETSDRPLARTIASPVGWRRATTYAWDRVGNLLAIGSDDPALVATFVYDDLYRLESAVSPQGEPLACAYADDGALVFKSDVGDYRYGEGGAAPTCATTAGTMVIGYAPTGDIVSAPWGTQTFDALGRLRRIEREGSGSADYVYDWRGRRVSSTVTDARGQVTMRLTPDDLFSVEDGALVLHLYAGELLVAQQFNDGTVRTLHRDHLGSVVATSDETGKLVDSMRYDTFGRILAGTASRGLGYTGGRVDAASPLVYLGARHYHPGLGLFVSVDPVVNEPDNPIAWAAYVYCGNNPMSRTDPTGMGFGLGKALLGLLALVGLAALAVVTAGAAAPGELSLIAAAGEEAALTSYVAVGAVQGGLIGGISVGMAELQSHSKFDVSDVLLGMGMGSAVGGWAALGAAYGPVGAGKLIGDGLGGAVTGGGHDIVAGALNNAITQIGAGFAHSVAEPIVHDDMEIGKFLTDVLQSAITGAVSGAVQAATLQGIPARLAPGNSDALTPTLGYGVVGAEQLGTAIAPWHHLPLVSTAQNLSLGTGLDLTAAVGQSYVFHGWG